MPENDNIQVGNHVYLTREAAQDSKEIAEKMFGGGTIKNIQGKTAEVEVTEIIRIHVSRLTTGKNAFDPIQ